MRRGWEMPTPRKCENWEVFIISTRILQYQYQQLSFNQLSL